MELAEVKMGVLFMRFEEASNGWRAGRLTQKEAAELLDVCERTFRRQLLRCGEGGFEGLRDKHKGTRSYTWVKNSLQKAGEVAKPRFRSRT